MQGHNWIDIVVFSARNGCLAFGLLERILFVAFWSAFVVKLGSISESGYLALGA